MEGGYTMEHSCGAVVFTRTEGEIRYVIARMGNGYHGFPKGHMEPGETETETALREIFEEVGLRPRLLDGFREESTYVFDAKGKRAKKVTFFLGEYADQEIRIQPEELADAALLPYSQAMAVLEFPDSREILTRAHIFLAK